MTPDDLQVRGRGRASTATVVFAANPLDDPTELHVWRWTDGRRRSDQLTDEPGVHTAVVGGATIVGAHRRRSTRDGSVTAVLGGPELDRVVRRAPARRTERARSPRSASGALATAVAAAADVPRRRPLPVLLDPYGGPHAQRVAGARGRVPELAVVRRPGLRRRGRRRPGHAGPRRDVGAGRPPRPGRGRCSTTRSTRCTPPPSAVPQLDLDRVAIRGWSFGGYLAALAVLRRPDVFHAAVAGAPVTEWRLYDTHYTERYLGDPTIDAEPYERSSLLADAPPARAAAAARSTGSPTTTWSPPTRCSCRRRCSPPAGRTRCCRCRASPT